ncbi:MAG: hypothetical protein ABGY96_06355 [bacterium]
MKITLVTPMATYNKLGILTGMQPLSNYMRLLAYKVRLNRVVKPQAAQVYPTRKLI